MGLRGLLEIEHLVNHGQSFALRQQWPDLRLQFMGHLRFVCRAARWQGGAGEGVALDLQRDSIDLVFLGL